MDNKEEKMILPPGLKNGAGTILMDPPWDIYQKGGKGGALEEYPLMTVKEIMEMPIGKLAAKDAHLWMWVTDAALYLAKDIIEHYGFTIRSTFVWIKPNHMGLGNWLRHGTEYCILATRGKSPIKVKNQIDFGFFPMAEHSHKPEELYTIIERCSPGPYLELFARRPRKGWARWGLETISDVVISGYPVPEYSAAVTENKEEDYMGANPDILVRAPLHKHRKAREAK